MVGELSTRKRMSNSVLGFCRMEEAVSCPTCGGGHFGGWDWQAHRAKWKSKARAHRKCCPRMGGQQGWRTTAIETHLADEATVRDP
jgi:hypothetical protein